MMGQRMRTLIGEEDKMRIFAAVLLAVCLAAAPAIAEKADSGEIAGTWYTEEIMMDVTEDGRFVLGWNDGDWTGTLEADPRTTEDGREYTAWRMILEDPDDVAWEDMELVPDPDYPGKMTFCFNGHEGDVFYNVPVCVEEMEDGELAYYEPYALIDNADGEGPAVTVMFTLLRPATDVAVLAMFDQEFDEEGNLGYNADALEWWAELDSQERIVVKHVFQGDLPDLSVSFLAEDGTRYDLAVEISGESGQLILVPLLPSNG